MTYDVLAVHRTMTPCDQCGEVIETITDGNRVYATDGRFDNYATVERDGTILRVPCPRPELPRRPECMGVVMVDMSTDHWRAATDRDRAMLAITEDVVRVD